MITTQNEQTPERLRFVSFDDVSILEQDTSHSHGKVFFYER
jgi:hypothetical protein